jgi:hypothetical protein
MNSSHPYEGTMNSRAIRKASKLSKGQPRPVSLSRLEQLLTERAESLMYSPTYVNPPRITRRSR